MVNIETLLSSSIAEEYNNFDNKYIIMIDVLRASSVICSALYHKANKIIPVKDVNDAFELYNKTNQNALICGERKSIKVDGFHLGNSPLEYYEDNVKNKDIILTTSNGTRIFTLGKKANKRVIAGFVNFDFVLKNISSYISKLKFEKKEINILIICAGTDGLYSREDGVLAGKIIYYISQQFFNSITYCDSSELVLSSFLTNKDNLKGYLSNSKHSNYLKSLNLQHDLEICFEEDVYPVLPIITENGIIVEK
jgi:2-phosphosulfolactate phosphatase